MCQRITFWQQFQLLTSAKPKWACYETERCHQGGFFFTSSSVRWLRKISWSQGRFSEVRICLHNEKPGRENDCQGHKYQSDRTCLFAYNILHWQGVSNCLLSNKRKSGCFSVHFRTEQGEKWKTDWNAWKIACLTLEKNWRSKLPREGQCGPSLSKLQSKTTLRPTTQGLGAKLAERSTDEFR